MAATIESISPPISDRKEFLTEAYERYSDALKGYLMRTVNEADAEDLMHDVYMRMSAHQGLSLIGNIKAFMFTMATNLLRDRWRRANARFAPTLVNYEDYSLSDGVSDPVEVLDWQERLDRVQKRLEVLPAKSRQAFELSRTGGYSYAEIAETMNVSVSMIEKHISLALRQIREVV